MGLHARPYRSLDKWHLSVFPCDDHCCHSITEGHQVGQAHFAFSKAVLAAMHHVLLLCCLSISSRRTYFTIFPGSEIRLIHVQFPSSPFLSIFKRETVISSFQSPGTLPCHHNFSGMMDRGFAKTSVTSLRNLGCVSTGPTDFSAWWGTSKLQNPSNKT